MAINGIETITYAVGLRVYNKKRVICEPDPVNAPGVVNRLNRTRK